MAGIISVSRTNLEGRRLKLRKKRQMRIIQAMWRTFAITGLAGGLLWMAIQPIWVLKAPKDIVISGNQRLSKQAIQSVLVLSYPQSLWRIEPFRIAESLKQQPTIAQATVSRRLFPAGLIIHIKERVPVAIAECALAPTNLSKASKDGSKQVLAPSDTGKKKVSVGLLDASGVWMPLEKYTLRNPALQLPSLKVIGLPEQYRPYWAQLYQALSQSSVKVIEIDWQDPTNLILKTELGKVYLGTPSFHLPEQIRVMAQMRHLPAQLNPSQIEYIDLKNPEFPLVQMIQKQQELNPQTP
ncbi:MAG: FtsQ-type POTRA domain-containing protein [Stigonema ocellatum SAG 48.90 = DSM 106950]|nr:FtsQ-type POTRA domain-containing protein [Stigonema ocellatum SAG 48.90 = DSM 106950]